MMKKIILPGLICLVLLSACSTNKDTGYMDAAPVHFDNDLAVVQFEQTGYFENSKVTTYLFHKTSDNPNIDEQLN